MLPVLECCPHDSQITLTRLNRPRRITNSRQLFEVLAHRSCNRLPLFNVTFKLIFSNFLSFARIYIAISLCRLHIAPQCVSEEAARSRHACICPMDRAVGCSSSQYIMLESIMYKSGTTEILMQVIWKAKMTGGLTYRGRGSSAWHSYVS